MLLKYQKITDEFTTHIMATLNEGEGVTELCTIGEDTYVYVADNVVLPEQPKIVNNTLESVTLTEELKAEIKAVSPHVELIEKRFIERLREKYTPDDELYFTRICVGVALGTYTFQAGEQAKVLEYQTFVEANRETARTAKEAIGL